MSGGTSSMKDYLYVDRLEPREGYYHDSGYQSGWTRTVYDDKVSEVKKKTNKVLGQELIRVDTLFYQNLNIQNIKKKMMKVITIC